MPRARTQPTPHWLARRVAALALTAAVILVAVGISILAPGLVWPAANLILLGFPAFACVVGLRELIRIAVALVFRFRLFGVRWGAGPCLLRLRWGSVHYRFGPIPLGADSRVASSRPRYHRLARWSLTLTPLLCQALVAWVGFTSGELNIAALNRTFAPLVMLQIANLTLLVIHALFPFETPSGLCSDLRLLTGLAMSGSDDDRAARASAYTMRIESRLASGELESARSELAAAMMQLGREPMLVQLEDRLRRIADTPNPDSAAREDAISDPFEHSWAHWDRSSASLSLPQRLASIGFGMLPIAASFIILSTFYYDDLLTSMHTRWLQEARSVSTANESQACHEQLSVFELRLNRLVQFKQIPRDMQLRQLRERAALHVCLGDFERAIRDQSLVVQIADSLRGNHASAGHPDSPRQIQAELTLSAQLRQLAIWHARHGAYRDALRATGRAERGLALANNQAAAVAPAKKREWARGLFDRERKKVEATQTRILEAMRFRS